MKKFLLSCFLALGLVANAQVTGTKTIGTDYATLAAAFTALNAQGVGAGGATINIPAGYTETAPAGGYQLGNATLNATLSAANPLIIQKSGTGANPVFTAYTGTSTTVDAFFKLAGVDYVTFDGLTLQESTANTTPTALMEYGFSFINLSATDGSQNNTVQNCTVNYLPYTSAVAYTVSTGISFQHTNAAGAAVTPTNATGMHNNNKIYGNTINNAMSCGIYIIGYASTTPFTLRDNNNDVGGSTAATGNIINNLGGFGGTAGGGYITTYGVFFAYGGTTTNISNNVINFSDGGL